MQLKIYPLKIKEDILHLLEEIKPDNIPIIVEGRNDKKALQELGLDNIFTLNLPLFKIVERIQGKEVVILTDLDKKGKELYRRIQHDCIHHGIKINNKLRHFLFRETELSHIEGLPRYLRNLEIKKMGPKGLSIFPKGYGVDKGRSHLYSNP